MKFLNLLLIAAAFMLLQSVRAAEPDSAFVFAYSTTKNRGSNGLHYAWSVDGSNWKGMGTEHRFLFSDYGNWGEQKKMFDPVVFVDRAGMFHCVWSLNDKVNQFAHAKASDLFTWNSQVYPYVMSEGQNVLMPEVSVLNDRYLITWLSDENGSTQVYKTTTADFKTFSPTVKGSQSDRVNCRVEVLIDGEKQRGTVHKVSWNVVDGLIKWYEWTKYREQLHAETLRDDATRFAGLETVEAAISFQPQGRKAISDLLIGVFFEDINYAADGGLYAELVQNRSFEYHPSDQRNRDMAWNSTYAWSFSGVDGAFKIDSVAPVHVNQKHYAVLSISKKGEALINAGFDGIALKSGEKYNFSTFARGLNGAKGTILVRLTDANGTVYAEATTKGIGSDWKKYEVVLTSKATVANARLEVIPQFTGNVAIDLVSLFPQNTFKGRKNGLRADLAQTIADMHPRFVRFPGGCVAHGDGLHNIYNWKNTVGPLEARKPQRNIWNYHQSMGLGYFEYFQYCEDIGAEPLPVIAAGVPCQNSSCGGYGQQGGIPMCEMDAYVQDILDLVEWANGDKNSKWGKLRAQAGHPEPFNLKYIGIGNEDLITDIFEERFTVIYNAIREKYPEIVVIGTVGPFSEGSDYREGWKLADKLDIPMVDEHYYQPPGWFLNNQDYYDRYDRTKSKVYLGEYAAHVPGRRMNMETALCEALHLINVERNADVVSMTSFAPLLAKEGHTQWNPDLIYFNNTEVKLTVDYHVQKLFGQNSGNEYVPSVIALSKPNNDVRKRVASSLVYDSKTGEYILKLANLLPVETKVTFVNGELSPAGKTATVTVLQGAVNDEKAQPEEKKVQIDRENPFVLPSYSLVVIRFK
jgi:alpha-L-arabinofuranosidase